MKQTKEWEDVGRDGENRKTRSPRSKKHAQPKEQGFQSVCGPEGSANRSAPFILLLSLFNLVLRAYSKFCLLSVLVNSGCTTKAPSTE